MDVAIAKESEQLTAGLPFLATVGSTATFVGLFGTVWGIKTAFEQIAIAQNTNLAVVAPGIAEALLATAMGLVAAVPAHAWQSARSLGPWTLLGCTVAPGFDFSGFELAPEGFQP